MVRADPAQARSPNVSLLAKFAFTLCSGGVSFALLFALISYRHLWPFLLCALALFVSVTLAVAYRSVIQVRALKRWTKSNWSLIY
jgi:hypothetical protein